MTSINTQTTNVSKNDNNRQPEERVIQKKIFRFKFTDEIQAEKERKESLNGKRQSDADVENVHNTTAGNKKRSKKIKREEKPVVEVDLLDYLPMALIIGSRPKDSILISQILAA